MVSIVVSCFIYSNTYFRMIAWNIGTRPVFICRAGQTMNESERSTRNLGMSRSENLGKEGRAFRDAMFSYMKKE